MMLCERRISGSEYCHQPPSGEIEHMSATDLPTPLRRGTVSYDLSDVSRRDPTCFKQVTADRTRRSFPQGATVVATGVNFSVFSNRRVGSSSCCSMMPLQLTRSA
jgi:hypothetical protein